MSRHIEDDETVGEEFARLRRRVRPARVFSRVRRIHTIRLAAERDITHERIATELGLSPLRVLVLCERHGIPVRRGLQPVRHPPMPPREDEPSPTPGRKPGEQDRIEQLAFMRLMNGGYRPSKRQPDPRRTRMEWVPGADSTRAPLFSLYASETGEPIQNVDIPLASLGEAGAWTVSKAPVVPGAKRINPAGTWGGSPANRSYDPRTAPEEVEAARRLNVRAAARGRKGRAPSKHAEARP